MDFDNTLNEIHKNVVPWEVLLEKIGGNSVNLPANTKYVYMHIPKAGGQTFSTILAKNVLPHEIFSVPGMAKDYYFVLKNMPPIVLQRLKILSGHNQLHKGFYALLHFSYFHFTMLRNPVERTISHYFYIKRSPEHKLYPLIKKNNVDIQTYVENYSVFRNQNYLVRYLSGSKTIDNSALIAAKMNIEHLFTFFGFVEQFDESIILLKHAMDLSDCLYLKKNVTQNRPKFEGFTKDQQSALHKSLAWDLELYNHAKELYKKRIVLLGESFHQEVDHFKEYLNKYKKLYEDY